uniref:Stabilizer of axonemal microtubules 1 n=1 Tax=Calidris pygmaea TaxID=425635 RepID=A0A8C3J0A0_9CHAR
MVELDDWNGTWVFSSRHPLRNAGLFLLLSYVVAQCWCLAEVLTLALRKRRNEIIFHRRDYIPHEVLPPKLKPPQRHVKSDSMDLTSTYKQDYNSYPISQVPPCLPRVTRHIPKEKFDYTTVVQDDYLYRGPVATQSCKPQNLLQKNKAPFQNTTNYRVSYVTHPLEKPYVHKYEKYKVNEVPFDGLTTHKISYKRLDGKPAMLAKPQEQKILHDLPFSSTTEFQEKYQAWPQPPIFSKKPDAYLPPLEKMDLHTTTQMHYKYPNGKPAKLCRSLLQLKKSTEPFNSSSVTMEDYKPWLSKRLKPITHAPELTFPAQPMDCLTTFQSHYVHHPLSVTKSYKPAWSGPKHDTRLDDKTIYATTYTPKAIVKCLASYKDPPGYVFEGNDADGHNLYLPSVIPSILKLTLYERNGWVL